MRRIIPNSYQSLFLYRSSPSIQNDNNDSTFLDVSAEIEKLTKDVVVPARKKAKTTRKIQNLLKKHKNFSRDVSNYF